MLAIGPGADGQARGCCCSTKVSLGLTPKGDRGHASSGSPACTSARDLDSARRANARVALRPPAWPTSSSGRIVLEAQHQCCDGACPAQRHRTSGSDRASSATTRGSARGGRRWRRLVARVADDVDRQVGLELRVESVTLQFLGHGRRSGGNELLRLSNRLAALIDEVLKSAWSTAAGICRPTEVMPWRSTLTPDGQTQSTTRSGTFRPSSSLSGCYQQPDGLGPLPWARGPLGDVLHLGPV